MRELSGRFRCGERLFHGRGLLRADDARADVREKAGVNRAASRFRKFSRRNDSAYDRASRLPDPCVSGRAETFHRTRNRFSGCADLAAARASWRLVSVVVVAANEPPVSVDNARSLRDQPGSRARNQARTTRSSVIVGIARYCCDLLGMDFAISSIGKMEYRQRNGLELRALGLTLRTAHFARARRLLRRAARSRIFSGTASPDWLDFICRYFGGCVCHRATASAIATILFRPNLWKLVAHYRRVSPSFAAASDLVSVGRLAVDRYTNPYLVCISSQKPSANFCERFACG